MCIWSVYFGMVSRAIFCGIEHELSLEHRICFIDRAFCTEHNTHDIKYLVGWLWL